VTQPKQIDRYHAAERAAIKLEHIEQPTDEQVRAVKLEVMRELRERYGKVVIVDEATDAV